MVVDHLIHTWRSSISKQDLLKAKKIKSLTFLKANSDKREMIWMKKTTIKGFIVVVMAIIVNVCTFPVTAFSLFTTQEGTSIFSIDYLIAAGT